MFWKIAAGGSSPNSRAIHSSGGAMQEVCRRHPVQLETSFVEAVTAPAAETLQNHAVIRNPIDRFAMRISASLRCAQSFALRRAGW
ncbi:MAG: hypothetical protein PGN34_13955 [Methylobacterium frigidaeris]